MGVCFITVFALALRSCSEEAGVGQMEADYAMETVETPGLVRSTDLILSDQPLEREAEERLITYRRTGGCSLECAGYLDLFGNAWGCVVQGDDWVEILVIRGVSDNMCSVQTIRLSAEG